MSRYQTGKTNLDFTGARDSEWRWHQQGHMQVCTSLQTDNHASTPPLSFFTGRMPFLPPNQQRQSTEGRSYRTQPYKSPMHCSKCVSFWGGFRTLDPLLIPHFPLLLTSPLLQNPGGATAPEACCRPWTWWCNDATALAGYATMMMTQNRSPHAISGSLSAFEKWSGHEVPKCCRKGRWVGL